MPTSDNRRHRYLAGVENYLDSEYDDLKAVEQRRRALYDQEVALQTQSANNLNDESVKLVSANDALAHPLSETADDIDVDQPLSSDDVPERQNFFPHGPSSTSLPSVLDKPQSEDVGETAPFAESDSRMESTTSHSVDDSYMIVAHPDPQTPADIDIRNESIPADPEAIHSVDASYEVEVDDNDTFVAESEDEINIHDRPYKRRRTSSGSAKDVPSPDRKAIITDCSPLTHTNDSSPTLPPPLSIEPAPLALERNDSSGNDILKATESTSQDALMSDQVETVPETPGLGSSPVSIEPVVDATFTPSTPYDDPAVPSRVPAIIQEDSRTKTESRGDASGSLAPALEPDTELASEVTVDPATEANSVPATSVTAILDAGILDQAMEADPTAPLTVNTHMTSSDAAPAVEHTTLALQLNIAGQAPTEPRSDPVVKSGAAKTQTVPASTNLARLPREMLDALICLYVGGIPPHLSDDEVKSWFYSNPTTSIPHPVAVCRSSAAQTARTHYAKCYYRTQEEAQAVISSSRMRTIGDPPARLSLAIVKQKPGKLVLHWNEVEPWAADLLYSTVTGKEQ